MLFIRIHELHTQLENGLNRRRYPGGSVGDGVGTDLQNCRISAMVDLNGVAL